MLSHSYKLFVSTTAGTVGVSQVVSLSLILRLVFQLLLVIFDMPQLILGVPPPFYDNLLIERDLPACAVEVHFAFCITKDCDGGEVVDESEEE